MAPGGIWLDHGGHFRIELVRAHPTKIAALQRRLALAELRGNHGKWRAGVQLGDDRIGKLLRVGRLGRVLDGDEDLAYMILGLPGLRFEQLALLLDLAIGDVRLGAKFVPQNAGPAELDANLVDQGAERDAAAAQAVTERALWHAIACLDLADGVGDVAVVHRDLPALHFLQTQAARRSAAVSPAAAGGRAPQA